MRVIIKIKNPNHNGGPQGDESKILWQMEDELTISLEELSVPCVMVARLTHGGRREIVFQVCELAKFRPPVGLWIKRNNEYAIDVSEHDGWQFFEDHVRPSELEMLRIKDSEVIQRLIKNGSDPKKVHSIEFVFLGEHEILKRIDAELSAKGYSQVSLSERTLVTALSLSLNLDEIFNHSANHLKLAKNNGIEYDGWGCLVVP